ncbi:MAG: integration host factor subunit beta [Planctomycetota bacterium]|jgi:integration host factor subunit beta
MPDEDIRTVTKRELVNRIAEETGQTKVVVRDVLQRFLESVIDELSVGNRLEFRDFGVFEVRERAARVAQNPRTLEKVPVPAKRVVKFKVGRIMRERVCEDLESAAGSSTDRSAGSSADGGATRSLNGKVGSSGVGSGATMSGAAGSSEAGSSAGSAGRKAHLSRGGGDTGFSQHAGEAHVEAEEKKPQPPLPPPSKPGSPF